MATAVLRSQDCLRGRFPPETLTSPPFEPRRNSKANPNPNPNPNPSLTRSGRKKRTPVGSPDKENRQSRCETTTVAKLPTKNMIMGQVTILKRGEKLKPVGNRVRDVVVDKEAKMNEVVVLCSTDRLGPEPEMIPKQICLSDAKSVNGVFAGSAFLTSPPPSSLPLPGFFTKKVVPSKIDAATTDLRRLLRLDLS